MVVIKKLLQMQPAQHGEIIKHMAKLLDSITVSSLHPGSTVERTLHKWLSRKVAVEML